MNLESPLWRRCYLHLRWYFYGHHIVMITMVIIIIIITITRLKTEQYVNTVPTIGFNCERVRGTLGPRRHHLHHHHVHHHQLAF